MNQKTKTPLLSLLVSIPLSVASIADETPKLVAADASKAAIERIGPPTFYAPPVERYRIGAPDVNNPAYYPIPTTAVTRDTYMAWIEQSGLLKHAEQPKLGMSGPTLLLPTLAKFVQSGEQHWGEACVAMLKDYHRALKAEVEAKGWVEQFAEPPAFLPIYRKHLIAGGLMTADEPWFKELWLDYCRNLHVWGTKPIEWRGPCHRSMPEALAKGLAAKWYPNIPEAAHWREYSLLVWLPGHPNDLLNVALKVGYGMPDRTQLGDIMALNPRLR